MMKSAAKVTSEPASTAMQPRSVVLQREWVNATPTNSERFPSVEKTLRGIIKNNLFEEAKKEF